MFSNEWYTNVFSCIWCILAALKRVKNLLRLAHSGPNLDKNCVQLFDAAPSYEI